MGNGELGSARYKFLFVLFRPFFLFLPFLPSIPPPPHPRCRAPLFLLAFGLGVLDSYPVIAPA